VKIASDRAIHNAMFAMLARQEGQWKIVCMSFPK
jgi:polysaccharide pyruvyl transferase WcaK-like protein